MHRGPLVSIGLSVLWVPLAFLFDGVTVLVLPVRLGGDAGTLGLVSLIGLGLAAGFQPVAGWWSDRLRDRVDRRTFITVAAVPAVIGLWLLAGTTAIVAAVAGYALIQLAASGMQAAQQTLIPEHLEQAQQGSASGLKAAFDVGGSFVAFLVLGELLASGDLRPMAMVVTAVLVVAVLTVLTLVPAVPSRRQASTGTAPRWPDGLGTLIVSRFLFLFATYAVGRFLLLLVAERLGLEPAGAASEAGGLLALFTLATAAAAVPAGRIADRRSRRDIMVAGAVIGSIGIVVLVAPAGAAGLIVGGLLMSLGTAAFVTANWAATTALVPPTESGRLMAIANLGTGLAAAAAGVLGPLIDAAGFAPALVIAAAASAAAAVPLLIQRAPLNRPREISA